MLDGIEANQIIVGAYTDRRGGVCPMLAAHRNGGRTDLASFARAWDRYTGPAAARAAATDARAEHPARDARGEHRLEEAARLRRALADDVRRGRAPTPRRRPAAWMRRA